MGRPKPPSPPAAAAAGLRAGQARGEVLPIENDFLRFYLLVA